MDYKFWKCYGIIYLANIVENVLLLMLYNIPITKSTIIGAGVFSLVATFIIDKIFIKCR